MEEICDWYLSPKNGSKLDKFLSDRITNGDASYYCDEKKDVQEITVKYFQCVDLNEVAKAEIWNQPRIEKIREWATPSKLRILRYDIDTDKIPHSEFFNKPNYFREYNLNKDEQNKFSIQDGIHRTKRARELGMDCILAHVEELVKIKKSDKENVVVNR